MIKYFKIANIIIKVKEEIDLCLNEKEQLFLTDDDSYDYDFEFIESDSFSKILDEAKCIYKGPFYHIFDYKGYELRAFFTKNYYYGVSYIGDKKGYFYFIDKNLLRDIMLKGPMQFLYICFEKILLKYNGIILHSSFINFENKAILFSAPSGTGKSTQADLWKKYKNAEIINGDRSALIKKDGKWFACGIPMNGTSGICINKSFPVEAIVLLKQNKENKICKLNNRDAFKSIYREITINNWNMEDVDKSMQLISDFIQENDIYLLECRIDEGAVNCLYDVLEDRFNDKK